MNIINDEPGDVADRINFILRDAMDNPAPVLRINADGIVLEYTMRTQSGTKAKFFEKVARLRKNNS